MNPAEAFKLINQLTETRAALSDLFWYARNLEKVVYGDAGPIAEDITIVNAIRVLKGETREHR